GGWDAVQIGCEALASNYPNGLCWYRPRTNVWVYPDPQTQPHRRYVTNLDYGPIPVALAALQAKEIDYYPSGLSEDEPQVPVVRIEIFGMYSTGGHSAPYYGLEVICTTNAVSHHSQPAHGGVPGDHYYNYKQVADRIYEIY